MSDRYPNVPLEKSKGKQTPTERLVGGMFLVTVAGFSLLLGFGRSFAAAKKREKVVDQTIINSIEGNSLALKALGWGSLIAITGVGAISYGIWKATGASNFQEFRQIVGRRLPQLTRNENGGRTEFNNLTELIQYIIDEDNRTKQHSTTDSTPVVSSNSQQNTDEK